MEDQNRTRTKRTTVRFTEEELTHLKEKIKASGLSMQEYIYQAAMNGVIVQNNDEEKGKFFDLISKLEVDVNGIGNNINQIARGLNTYKELFWGWDLCDVEKVNESFLDFREEAHRLCQLLRTYLEKMEDIKPHNQ